MFKKIKIIIILFFLFFSFNSVLAETSLPHLVPQGEKYDSGSYELSDLLQVGLNVSNIILGVVGSLALLMFVYGGVMMLISAGNSEKVSKAKNIIFGAIIGLVIVFTSYIIIQFVMSAFGIEWEGNTRFLTN